MVHPPDIGASVDGAVARGPLVSIVLTGRNDGYGGDFAGRFHRALRFNHQQLTARGIAHEVVFVEWAPPADVPLLVDCVSAAIPDLDATVCSWYVVDPGYQRALCLNPRLGFLEFIAKNVGIRRARGRFVLTTNCDVFLGRRVLDVLQSGALSSRVLYRAPRHDLNLPEALSAVDWEILEDPGSLSGPAHRLKPPYMGSATGDFVLLDRESFHDIRGFNEIYRVARIGVDRNLLVKALSGGIAIEDIGGPVYHENHEGSYRLDPSAFVGREAEAHWGDRRWHSKGVSYLNPPTWGLAHAPARRRGEGGVYLDFSWSAVPPLVDLRRVVLPAARIGSPAPGQYTRRQ